MSPSSPALKRPLGVTKASFPRYLRRFLETKEVADEAAARQRKQRDELMAFVERYGIEDERGHLRVDAPGVGTAKRERRVSDIFDAEFAEEYLRANSLWDECSTTIVVIDEDKVVAKIFEGVIPKKVSEKMYSTKETFAFKVEGAS
jgi:hypothetical protein